MSLFEKRRRNSPQSSLIDDLSTLSDGPLGEGPAGWKVAAAGTALLVLAAGVGAGVLKGQRAAEENARNPSTLCLEKGLPPVSTLALLDVTDRLAADSGDRFTRLVQRLRDDLPRNARLTIVPFADDLGQSLAPAIDICSPGRGEEANGSFEGPGRIQRAYETKFQAPLQRIAQRLSDTGASANSPIAEQIVRAASDPAISWSGTRRELTLFTDGLQNTPSSRVYSTGAVRLPPPPPGILQGVTVNYIELTNPRHNALQSAQVRLAWKAWFEAAGAERVRMFAPGFPPPA
ncbi:MAG TPA: hypothetical protein VF759_05540 [Allosphingosinicella sp.]|jgi:hypothetical protein